jgi:hypothetical protein
MKLLAAVLSAFLLFGMVSNAGAAEKLRHVVSFKFKSTATSEEVKKVEQEFRGLKKKIREIVDLEWGTNVSKEKLNKGFTHCFIVTFKSEKDRDAYIVHPAHAEFVKLVGPVLEEAFVIDFWAQK